MTVWLCKKGHQKWVPHRNWWPGSGNWNWRTWSWSPSWTSTNPYSTSIRAVPARQPRRRTRNPGHEGPTGAWASPLSRRVWGLWMTWRVRHLRNSRKMTGKTRFVLFFISIYSTFTFLFLWTNPEQLTNLVGSFFRDSKLLNQENSKKSFLW